MEHYDVVVVGAGLAGIGFSYYLQRKCPDKSYRIFEARARLGGTWDLFRYPGVRSDVNMHVYGYSFEPWPHGPAIASGNEIREYLEGTARNHGIAGHIQFEARVVEATWSSSTALWTLTIEYGANAMEERVTCNWLQICTGYYSYERGHDPEFAGREAFKGTILHPQNWPERDETEDKKIVVIGSGATAVTLIPALSEKARHVTLVQRSQSYVLASGSRDHLGELLEKVLPRKMAFNFIRKKNILLERLRWWMIINRPEAVKAKITKEAKRRLPSNFQFERHFVPSYEPREQRICFSPDGDFFEAISQGNVTVVTESVKRFDKDGIVLSSGDHVNADIIVTATGLNMQLASGMDISVDDEPFSFSDSWGYRGIMMSGVPNFALTVGSLVAPYTLRVEMISRCIMNVIRSIDRRGADWVKPVLPVAPEKMEMLPFVTGFSSGYVQRAIDHFPKQGTGSPWVNPQDYRECRSIYSDIADDGVLQFDVKTDHDSTGQES